MTRSSIRILLALGRFPLKLNPSDGARFVTGPGQGAQDVSGCGRVVFYLLV